MSWLSAGSEGGTLNKRLGIFNLSWSVAMIAGAYVGGLAYGVAYWRLASIVSRAYCRDRMARL